jgi:hypothetical protein
VLDNTDILLKLGPLLLAPACKKQGMVRGYLILNANGQNPDDFASLKKNFETTPITDLSVGKREGSFAKVENGSVHHLHLLHAAHWLAAQPWFHVSLLCFCSIVYKFYNKLSFLLKFLVTRKQ